MKRRMTMSEEFIMFVLVPLLLIPVGYAVDQILERMGR